MAGNSAGRGDRSYKPAPLSSILSPATNMCACRLVVWQRTFNPHHVGSIPTGRTMAPYRPCFLNR